MFGKQGQIVPGWPFWDKGLAQGPNGDIIQLTMRFEPPTFRSPSQHPCPLSHILAH